MKKILYTICAVAVALLAGAQQKEALTKAAYERAEQFLSYNTYPLVYRTNVNPHWLGNSRFWYSVNTAEGTEYVLVDAAKGTRAASMQKPGYATAITKIARPNEVLSPDSTKAAFIKNYNLWVRDIATGKETQLTTDGEKDYGYATDNAGWKHSDKAILSWSPDSKKIATFKQDQRKVGDMYLVTTNVGHPTLQSWKYPLPGDSVIAMIERVIVEVETPKVIKLQVAPDPHRATLSDDISSSGTFDDVNWSADGSELAFVSTSRNHQQEKLRIANATTGEVREVFEETVATQFESGQDAINWRYLPKSNEIIWFSERDDWGHLYLYDATTGKVKNQITRGAFTVTQLLRVDPKTRMVYFLAAGGEKRNPYFMHLYSAGLDGKNIKLLTPELGNHEVSLSPDGSYFTDTYSQPDVAPVTVLRNSAGKQLLTLEKGDITALLATGWQPPKVVTVKAADGQTDLYGLMFSPTQLDQSKKYPVVDYIYPGPQGGSVRSWSFTPSHGDNQALAELGFVVVAIEGSCNPLRSKSYHDLCYGNMAENTLHDQVSGIKQLAQQYPFVDTSRVGIWGHSGGGYATAAAMFRHPDFFDVGISESGNHENLNYEDDWGERYIGLVTPNADGTTNYTNQANAPFAKNLKGKLMLAHGMMDDNVPPYNTMLVIDALQKANKDFDLVIFPHARHGFGELSYYMMRRRWDYFVENLLGKEPPKEYQLGPKKG